MSPDEGDLRPETRENQELASNYGIDPIQIQVIDQDEVKFQRAYMGLVIIHGDLIERIPTITGTDQLEYQLTTAIMKLNNKVSALLRLKDKIRIKLILSSSLSQVAPYMGLKTLPEIPQKVEEIVGDLNRKLFDKLEYRYLDPSKDQQAQQELNREKYNILNLQWPDTPRENISAGQGSAGLVLQYSNRTLTIPLISVLRLPLIGTQYQLVDPDELEDLISENVESLININEDLGYLADKGTIPLNSPRQLPGQPPPSEESLNNFRTILSKNYTMKEVDLESQAVPSSLNCLVIVRPTQTFSEYDLYQIDQFLMQGKSLALFIDAFNEVFPGGQAMMSMGRGPSYIPIDTGLQKLLEHYGVRIKSAYVMDENCFKQELPSQMGGGERPIYFAPLIQNRMINKELDFIKDIKRLVALKVSPLELMEEKIAKSGVNAHRLFASSEKSWEMRGQINLNPNFIFPPNSEEVMQSYPLAYLLEGEFESYFKGKPVPVREQQEKPSDSETPDETAGKETATAEAGKPQETVAPEIRAQGEMLTRSKPAKIFLLASSEMLRDNVIDDQARTANSLFILNLVDALNNRGDIAVMRTKRQLFNPLQETTPGTKTVVKTFNIVGLPILVVLFGLSVWVRRNSKKKRILAMFQG